MRVCVCVCVRVCVCKGMQAVCMQLVEAVDLLGGSCRRRSEEGVGRRPLRGGTLVRWRAGAVGPGAAAHLHSVARGDAAKE